MSYFIVKVMGRKVNHNSRWEKRGFFLLTILMNKGFLKIEVSNFYNEIVLLNL